ncbi:hypothetical protein Aeh1ORF048c [Aeromonas phage Aeh1]|uniref:Uncharacterized protein n=1 Tax=Aeromonas phage Aeh1 TaxID=2880362 RepID=Q76Z39_9CAUD|nr:hypothetical protein Aeh1p052 [Aeromonas phage Aeh1]AAQ17707.1 hypothetical protein Aeh1ORF048c [Aeromonas phage Aeh1]
MNELQTRIINDPTVSEDVKYYVKNKERFDVSKAKLNDIIDGRITREECKIGICRIVGSKAGGVDLCNEKILNGYKFWSGWEGHSILIGNPDEMDDPLNEAIAQFHQEADEESEGNDEYWEARLELARHWLRYILKLQSEYCDAVERQAHMNDLVRHCVFNRSEWEESREILRDVIIGKITRDQLKEGLCEMIKVKLNGEYILKDYKFWSGWKGYIILLETDEVKNFMPDPRAKHYTIEDHKRNQAIKQFKDEVYCSMKYDTAYYEARLELARHWLKVIENVMAIAKN